jgi:hypothetical protein
MFVGGMVALPLAIQQAKWFGASEAFFYARSGVGMRDAGCGIRDPGIGNADYKDSACTGRDGFGG